MPAGFAIDDARGLVLSRAWGAVGDRDLITHARTLVADPRFRPSFRQLVDFRGMERMDVSSEGARRMVDMNPFGAHARRAIVAESDISFGMARMYQILHGDGADEVQVFRDFDVALEWLGLEDAKEEILAGLAVIVPV